MRSMVEGARNESASLLACGLAERSVQGRRCCAFLRLNGLFRLAMVFGGITPSTALRAVPLPRKRGRMKRCGSRPRTLKKALRVAPAADAGVHASHTAHGYNSSSPPGLTRRSILTGREYGRFRIALLPLRPQPNPRRLRMLACDAQLPPPLAGEGGEGQSPHGLPVARVSARPGNDVVDKSNRWLRVAEPSIR